jgi:hypothetical protein
MTMKPSNLVATLCFLTLTSACGTTEETAAAEASTENAAEDWSIQVRHTAWCDQPDACWREARINSVPSIVLWDAEGSVVLADDAVAALLDEWEDVALTLESDECSPGTIQADPAPPLEVEIVRGSETVFIPNAWGCTRSVLEPGTDLRLGTVHLRTYQFAHTALSCPPWEPASGLAQPSEITEDTPRFICLWAERPGF